MSVTAIVGANWGDEGKGKMIDALAREADLVVRFQGGANAGHTVINEFGKFALHLLPSGVFHPQVHNLLGPGVAVEIDTLARELNDLCQRGIAPPRLAVSNRAQIVLPYHRQFDGYEEERLGAAQFGSTRSGIAPFYADKSAKIGVQVNELADLASLERRLSPVIEAKNVLLEHLYHRPKIILDELMTDLARQAELIRPFVQNTTDILHAALASGKRILLEGQLGALRDPDHGIFPFTTSSSPLAGFASVGAGLPAGKIERVVAVTKAYSTCVGAGPFVTELAPPDADELRARGGDAGEYGATTGRPRRVGWFDAVATRYGCRLQGATELAVTCLDVLGYLDKIPLSIAYQIDGVTTTQFPVTGDLWRATPVIEELPGWRCAIGHVKTYGDLPAQARRYIERIEDLLQLPVKWISVGPNRDALLPR